MKLPVIYALIFALLAFILVSVASGLPLWSKDTSTEYGLWEKCDVSQGIDARTCKNYNDDLPPESTCRGLWNTAQAFSALSIAFLGIQLLTTASVFVFDKVKGKLKRLIRQLTVPIAWLSALWVLLTFLVWWVYSTKSECGTGGNAIHNLDSSFILQVIAWFLSLLALGAAIWMMETSPVDEEEHVELAKPVDAVHFGPPAQQPLYTVPQTGQFPGGPIYQSGDVLTMHPAPEGAPQYMYPGATFAPTNTPDVTRYVAA